jgi:quinol-cytochrome oxidoreductase complex cytochrome b subunit
MGSHPINLAVRFILEITALVSLGYWGWQIGEGWVSYLLAVGAPILAALVWGTFAVPGDPSRSGKAPVPVPGLVRLILELLIFGLACWALFATGLMTQGRIFCVVVILHYAVSYDRILWLGAQKEYK